VGSDQYTEERLRKIHDEAKARGDDEAVGLAHALLWAQEFCDESRDAAVAIGREVRRVFPILAITTSDSFVDELTTPLREMLAELLEGVHPKTTTSQNGPDLEVKPSHWAMRSIAESLAKSCKHAPNFVSAVRVGTPEGRYVVTVEKPGGLPPGELVAELKAEIALLKREYAALKEEQSAK